MSRSTQFIGLNNFASDFVKYTLVKMESSNHYLGMFDEVIPLGQWKDSQGYIWREVVQMEPWSSGPMIFTALVKETNINDLIFPWFLNENLNCEYDRKEGEYNV